MKGRIKLFVALLAIITLAAGTGTAFAAPAEAPSLTGALCLAGDVKWNEGSGYEYTDGSATITGDANSITITIADGYTFVSGCIKIGGPGGGTTISISGPGTYGPFEYGISHAVITTDQTYQVCSETVAVEGEWGDWEIYEQDPSKLVHYKTITYVDSQDPQVTCDEEVVEEFMDRPVCEWDPAYYADEPECEPPPGEAAYTWDLRCEGVTVTLDHLILYVQFEDQDAIAITEDGQYPLGVGGYSAWVEVEEGFELAEGLDPEWTFSIGPCPVDQPPRETGTGPETFGGLLRVLGGIGLAVVGSYLTFRKRG